MFIGPNGVAAPSPSKKPSLNDSNIPRIQMDHSFSLPKIYIYDRIKVLLTR
jgi:hypothetical protein